MSRSAQNDGYAAQTNPTPDPTRTLTLTQPFGALGLPSRSAGAVLSLRAILKTLHVRAIKRLVVALQLLAAGSSLTPPCCRRDR